jgi:hypothetical protein
MKKIFVICENREHLNKLVSTVRRSVTPVKGCTRTQDLDGMATRSTKDARLILLSLAGKADAPWDLWYLRHKFPCAKMVVELDIDSPERADHIRLWGAFKVFTKKENACDVIADVMAQSNALRDVS